MIDTPTTVRKHLHYSVIMYQVCLYFYVEALQSFVIGVCT
jgi:hypothetical protein